jgi:hypothetical protein
MPSGVYVRTEKWYESMKNLGPMHSKSKTEYWKIHKKEREIRTCGCGCGFAKRVYKDSAWKYKQGHWSRLPEYNFVFEKRSKSMIGKNKGKRSWAKGLTANTSSIVAVASQKRKAKQNEITAKILKSNLTKPNKFEIRALQYLEKIYPGKFSYCGDGSLVINGRSPDAIDTKTKTVALLNGYYWHLKKRGLEVNDINKRIVENIESEPFVSAGYKVIFVWEDEI